MALPVLASSTISRIQGSHLYLTVRTICFGAEELRRPIAHRLAPSIRVLSSWLIQDGC
jgi:hypothetical protein